MKLIQIIEGWWKKIFKMNDALANERLKFCNKCSFNVDGICSSKRCTKIYDKTICGCGCYIDAKVRNNSSECPKGLWLKK